MTEKNDTSSLPPAEWIEAINRGEADLAAGRTIPVATLLAKVNASNERMIARLTKKAPDAA